MELKPKIGVSDINIVGTENKIPKRTIIGRLTILDKNEEIHNITNELELTKCLYNSAIPQIYWEN